MSVILPEALTLWVKAKSRTVTAAVHAVQDLNGDGKIDIVDLELEMACAGASSPAEKGVHQNA
jgi:uncharacterized protein (DUF2141 family)